MSRIGEWMLAHSYVVIEMQRQVTRRRRRSMKNWYASKTLWFNVFTCVVLIATACINSGVFQNAAMTSALGLIAAIGNIILRVFFTNQSIKPPFAPPSAST